MYGIFGIHGDKSDRVVPGIKDTLIICEFLDVFLNNFSRLAQKREV